MKERQKKMNLKGISPEELRQNNASVLNWIKSTGCSKVAVHFDLDVIDPNEMIAGVGIEPNGMKIEEVVNLINEINDSYDLVGLTVAEPMPKIAIKLKNMLEKMPLIK